MSKDGFDIKKAFEKQLAELGIESGDLGDVRFSGEDPVFNHSVLRLGATFSIAAMLAAAGIAAIWKHRTGRRQNIGINLHQASHGISPHATCCPTLNGNAITAPLLPGNPFLFSPYKTADCRHIFLSAVYPHQEREWLSLLNCGPSVDQVSAAVNTYRAQELEDLANQRGSTCCMARTPAEWLNHPQGSLLAAKPLIEIKKIRAGAAIPFVGARPLSNIRVLSFTHAIAGPTVGRTLAEQGADVLQITDPQGYEHPLIWQDANVGHRTAFVDLRTDRGLALARDLVRQSDLLVISFRPGKLEKLGLSPAELIAINPNLIIVNISCYGVDGPWKQRGGFDMLGSAASGLAAIEGRGGVPRLPGFGLLNDYVTGYLGAAGATAALLHRSREGGGYTVEVSLTRSAMWCASMGTVEELGGDVPHRLEVPRTILSSTPLGTLRRLAPAVSFSETYPGWELPILVPLGSSSPAFL